MRNYERWTLAYFLFRSMGSIALLVLIGIWVKWIDYLTIAICLLYVVVFYGQMKRFDKKEVKKKEGQDGLQESS